jgi:hypothetical protein
MKEDSSRPTASPLYPSLSTMPTPVEQQLTVLEERVGADLSWRTAFEERMLLLELAKEREDREKRNAKGGEARARQKKLASWVAWRKAALWECKPLLREIPNIKRAAVLRRLIKLNPDIKVSTIKSAVDAWKKRARPVWQTSAWLRPSHVGDGRGHRRVSRHVHQHFFWWRYRR